MECKTHDSLLWVGRSKETLESFREIVRGLLAKKCSLKSDCPVNVKDDSYYRPGTKYSAEKSQFFVPCFVMICILKATCVDLFSGLYKQCL